MKTPVRTLQPDPMQSNAKRISWGDVLLFLLTAGGTCASAALPIYVHFHPQDFGPPRMAFSGDLERKFQSEEFTAQYERQVTALIKPQLQLDKLVTGSIRGINESGDQKMPKRLIDQPFPEDVTADPFTIDIVFVSGNRALVIDAGKIEMMEAGSLLSDGSRISSINRRADGHWTVETTKGRHFDWNSGQ